MFATKGNRTSVAQNFMHAIGLAERTKSNRYPIDCALEFELKPLVRSEDRPRARAERTVG